MEENKKDVLPLEGEPLTAPQISEPVVNALAAALSKIETYVPTQYIDDGPPDIDADHLNHAEQAIMRVTNLANGAADAISALQSQVTQLNNNLSIGKIPNKILYISSTNDTDCNLLTNHFVLAKGKNFPTGDGFWYVQTIGYEIKPDGTVRTGKQIAYQYTGTKLFTRDCYNDVWEGWAEYITKSDLTDYIRYENVPITIPASAVYVDVPLSYTCNYVRSAVSINGSGIIIIQAARAESKKVRLYVVEKEIERQTTVCIGYSL